MPTLYRHPVTPAGAIHTIDAELTRIPGGVAASFLAMGDVTRLVLPRPAARERTDDLWRTTCFELFVAGEGESYWEFNLSPSGAWAAYQFDRHREGRRAADAAVEIEISSNEKTFSLKAEILPEFPDPVHVGLTAVIEEADRLLRYWATSFAPGEPDFHAAATRSLLLDGVSAE